MRRALFAIFFAVFACEPTYEAKVPEPAAAKPHPPVAILEPDEPHRVGWIEFEPQWRGTSFGTYLAPKEDFADAGGGVDIIFHFHGGMLAEKEWRATGINAILVSVTYGVGSAVYAAPFTDPARFANMVSEVLKALKEAKSTGPLHARRIALVSWSAGYGSIGNILRTPKYFKQIDSVILLDSLHASFTPDHKVDIKMLDPFIRLAKEAVDKRKLFVMTHSAILPPDYVSTTEAANAVIEAVGAFKLDVPRNDRGMVQLYRVDKGDFHVRGYEGAGTKDHTDHLESVGELALQYIVPRWADADEKPNAEE